ncbi:MAG: GNAT family N-acetyltransferase [Sphingomonadaceae bacterium]
MFHRTERLLLRPAWMEDAEGIYAGIGEHAVIRNLARAPWPYTLDNAREFLALEHGDDLPRFLVTLPGDDGSTILGMIGLNYRDQDIELGYWIAKPFWGQGIATEAARGLIEVARNIGISRISASHFVDNPASGRVLRKAGFVPTGEIRQLYSLGRGETAPSALYSLDLTDCDYPPMRVAA